MVENIAKVFLTLAFIFGCIRIINILLQTLSFIYRHIFRPLCTRDLFQKYAHPLGGSWALVTGGSDGIGLEMCHQLAEMGFNIVMCGRNE